VRGLVAPDPDDFPDLLGPIKLGDAQLAEIQTDAIEPRGPVLARRSGKVLVVGAGAVALACIARAALCRFSFDDALVKNLVKVEA